MLEVIFTVSVDSGAPMPLPIVRYALDPTGVNLDNRVVGEVHTLSARSIRAVAPTYGAYYSESLRVYDHSTDTLLSRGTDYQCVELLQDASLRYGKEICLVVLILNSHVSNQVRLDYQVVGGHYTNDATGIVNLYETVIRDNRPVDWLNVLNRPTEYPPTLHNHLLTDIVGFGPVIAAIERVRNAIIVSDIPAYEALIEWVQIELHKLQQWIENNYVSIHQQFFEHIGSEDNPHNITAEQIGLGLVENLPVVTHEDVYRGDPVRKYVTHDMFAALIDFYMLNSSIRMTPSQLRVSEGRTIQVLVESTNVPNDTRYYWTIDHLTTDDEDFTLTSGIVTIHQDRAVLWTTLVIDDEYDPNETFRILLRRESPTGPVIASTGVIEVTDVQREPDDLSRLYMVVESIYDPRIRITAESFFFIRSLRPETTTRIRRRGGSSFNQDTFTELLMGGCYLSPSVIQSPQHLFYAMSESYSRM